MKKVVESVKEKVTPTVLLRNANSGQFSQGVKPAGKSPSGKFKGEPFWEV